jgi:hypothetical protein
MASSDMRGAVRIGDRDRADAADRLAAHAAAGRLTMAELEERLEQAHAAISTRDLQAIEADLPTAAPRRGVTPHRAFIAIMLLIAAAAGSVVVGHPLIPLFFAGVVVWRARLWAPRGRQHMLARSRS